MLHCSIIALSIVGTRVDWQEVVFRRSFHLHPYGALSEKCITVWSNSQTVLDAVADPPVGLNLAPPTLLGSAVFVRIAVRLHA